MTNLEFAAGLREIGAFYEAHPDVPQPFKLYVLANNRDEFETMLRALGPVGLAAVPPKQANDYFYAVERSFGPGVILRLDTYAGNVCRKVQRTALVEAWEYDPTLEACDAAA
jgi:hypothetical protein